MQDDPSGTDVVEVHFAQIENLTSGEVAALREWALIPPDERVFIRQFAQQTLSLRRAVQILIIFVTALGGLALGATAILNFFRTVLPQQSGGH